MNTDNTYFDYIYNQGEDTFYVNFPTIIFIHSGELVIYQESGNLVIGKGESAFFCYGAKVCICKNNKENELFCGMYIGFSQIVLSELKLVTNYNKQYNEDHINTQVVPLPCVPCIQSLYISMAVYWEWGVKPTEDIIRLKQQEGVFSLLLIDQQFQNTLSYFVNRKQYFQDIFKRDQLKN